MPRPPTAHTHTTPDGRQSASKPNELMAQGEAAPDSDSVIVLDHDHDDDDDDGSFPREEICILSSTEACESSSPPGQG